MMACMLADGLGTHGKAQHTLRVPAARMRAQAHGAMWIWKVCWALLSLQSLQVPALKLCMQTSSVETRTSCTWALCMHTHGPAHSAAFCVALLHVQHGAWYGPLPHSAFLAIPSVWCGSLLAAWAWAAHSWVGRAHGRACALGSPHDLCGYMPQPALMHT